MKEFQNVPPQIIDYFQLQALEEQQMQRGSLISPFLPEIRSLGFPRERCLPVPQALHPTGEGRTFLSPEPGRRGETGLCQHTYLLK